MAYHLTCGLYSQKNNDQDIHICSACIVIPEVRNRFSLPPSRSRSNSDFSTASYKRKKEDLVQIHQQSNLALSSQVSGQHQNEYSTQQEQISALSSPAPTLQLNNDSQHTSTNTQPYSPKPFLTIQDQNNATIKELHEVFSANFISLRNDYCHLNNIQKIQHQDSINFYNVIKGQGAIIQAQEEKIEDLSRRLQSLKTDLSSDLMISGLEISDKTDLRKMIVTLANYLKVNIKNQDIRKARLVNHNNSSLVQVTFYSSAHTLQLLDNKRAFGRLVNSNVFNFSLSNGQIFINECLPQEVHKLLMAAKQARKNYGFFKVWHKNGQILVHVNPQDRAYVISNITELQDLTDSYSNYIQHNVSLPQHEQSQSAQQSQAHQYQPSQQQLYSQRAPILSQQPHHLRNPQQQLPRHFIVHQKSQSQRARNNNNYSSKNNNNNNNKLFNNNLRHTFNHSSQVQRDPRKSYIPRPPPTTSSYKTQTNLPSILDIRFPALP